LKIGRRYNRRVTGNALIRTSFFHTPEDPTRTAGGLVSHEDGALLIRNGRIASSGNFADVRAQAPDAELLDWRGGYVLPGLVDTHVHFPQLRIIGGLGRTLLAWLDEVALPEEARMADAACADDTARRFVAQLLAHGTTTALVFGSHFAGATASLFEAATAQGLRLATGLILSDRALLPSLHLQPELAHAACSRLIERFHGHGRLLYAVTPRFALSTSDAMFEVCQSLVREHPDLLTQTHINEQPEEVDACLRAFPWAADYLGIYERYGLVGPRTVLAHNVQTTAGELERMAVAGVTVSHCPCSNAALGSGIFPMARHLAAGVRVALGTDVGGGTGFGMLKESLQAYLMQRVAAAPMTLAPAYLLYLASRAGALALGLDGETGDLQPGRSADLLYIRPAEGTPLALTLERVPSLTDALAAIITMAGASDIEQVLVGGDVVSRRTPTP